mgnify:CR=1 FL=1
MLEHTTDSIAITDDNANIKYVNNAFINTTGYSSQELLHSNMRILKSGEHEQSFYAKMWEQLRTGHAWEGELTNQHKDGHCFLDKTLIIPNSTLTHQSVNNWSFSTSIIRFQIPVTIHYNSDVDLAKETFKRLNLEVKFQPIDWAMKETELNSGNIDMIWNGYTITPEREEKVTFTKPYLENRQVIITLKNSDKNKMEECQSSTEKHTDVRYGRKSVSENDYCNTIWAYNMSTI